MILDLKVNGRANLLKIESNVPVTGIRTLAYSAFGRSILHYELTSKGISIHITTNRNTSSSRLRYHNHCSSIYSGRQLNRHSVSYPFILTFRQLLCKGHEGARVNDLYVYSYVYIVYMYVGLNILCLHTRWDHHTPLK